MRILKVLVKTLRIHKADRLEAGPPAPGWRSQFLEGRARREHAERVTPGRDICDYIYTVQPANSIRFRITSG